ncbi:MAG: ABC transporter ATP-binding protein [Desulfarculaceae bacterium]|nr:ABC transporter ATP-binding protein [Desulfarculaceae bacterium]MCF8048627.1 ABC transporter ATP-binding protein [Desulfarculaceae bacterium]MCF8063960.1 ABC transporter ATP-binding protein [Desulfarculaceae bacterium]MCF8096723.1 ABC transporter ATP-binding protein [Desulfarculaceae bacterium]MCF8123019.1 ABC transporter ATP-binding protein [Desulfarculaceae bacterium]
MAILEIQDLSMVFGGITALDHVSLSLEQGSITAVIGPNGAGKTTLFNCITGLYKPTRGQVSFKGKRINGMKPYKIAALGLGRTFQNIELFNKMTTLDNLLLGRHLHMRTGVWSGSTFFRRGSRASAEEIAHRGKVEEIIDFLDLQHARNRFVGGLPYGTQKVVELGRALAMEPEVLLLDEPVAGMNMEEKQDLMIWLGDIKEELGITLLVIEHDMRLVMEISDEIMVLNYGEPIARGKPEHVQNHPEVLKAYLGEESALEVA